MPTPSSVDDHESLDKNAGATSISLAKLVLNEEDESAHSSHEQFSCGGVKPRQYFGEGEA